MARERVRFDCLDGLRGWAALSVVLFHATSESFGPAMPVLETPWFGFFNDGGFAVRVFFVLSGFVLSRRFVVVGDADGVRRLAAGRYARLVVPIGLISAIGYVMLSFGLFHNVQAGTVLDSAWLADQFRIVPPGLFYFVRFAVFDAFTAPNPAASYNPFIWTMQYELIGSFILLSSLGLFGSYPAIRRAVLGLGIVLALAIDPLYALFFEGALLAETDMSALEAVGERWRDLVGVTCCAGAWLACAASRDQFQSVIAPLLLAGVLISPWMQRALETRWSRFLGRVSFPLYLVHGYVLAGPVSYAVVFMNERGVGLPVIAGTAIPAIVVLSLGAAALLEPVERLAKWASHWVGDAMVGVRR